MSRTLLTDLRQTVCDQIKAALPDLRTCDVQEGRFDLKELKRQSIAAPAVVVSLISVKKTGGLAGSAPVFAASMAAFILTKNKPLLTRDIAAMNIGTAILSLVDGNVWGMQALDEPEQIRLESLITGQKSDSNTSLWAVSWDQPFTLFQAETPTLGAEIYVGHEPDSAVDYQPVGGAS